ncbi:MLO-like protein 5 [Dichanthelium oligosanthes]|uniref:MLO-like protein n=1 Tax=Dichanthelium oligosanthes TaxID=888268 RepID=A0A1E5V2R6_9POAL|nr:MLO-like protein 5 [Dichanthelium oligosanthes]
MGGGGGGSGRELDQTPTWAVSSVCGVIVIISILLEKGLHHVGEFFSHRKKKAMVEALEKVKAELMVLGFISLLLVFGQNYIIKICISNHAADTMLPCKVKGELAEAGHGKEPAVPAEASGHGKEPAAAAEGGHGKEGGAAEHLGSVIAWPPPYYAATAAGSVHHSRLLAEASMKTKCPEGKVSLISINALHQLHIFIFFLAVFHVSYSAITMALGRAKIRAWKEWEKEAAGQDFEFSNDPTRFRFTHETSFVRQHMNVLNKTPASFYISNFFRQFFRSVRKADYCALRHSFVNVHLAPGSKFDFQKYIKRSMEDDFKVIVGISPPLWASALIFLLLNVNGWHTMLWISIMPVVIILCVGTKLQGIICRMAIDITERHAVIQGIPLVQVSDSYFWFARPTFVLFLIHFTLFQNGFQIIYFLWILYEYGMDSCFNDSKRFVFARLCLGVLVQVLCSYVTLPLYALVSQMGSTMKQSIFDEQTSKALKNWRAGVKKKAPTSSKHGGQGSPTAGGSPRSRSPTKADEGIALADRKDAAQADAGTGLQAGAAQAAAKKGQDGDYEFIKIDE